MGNSAGLQGMMGPNEKNLDLGTWEAVPIGERASSAKCQGNWGLSGVGWIESGMELLTRASSTARMQYHETRIIYIHRMRQRGLRTPIYAKQHERRLDYGRIYKRTSQ
jgi:hypothetical protein